MSFAGLSITKELAVIACVADATADGSLANGQPVALQIYTYADGRAFRGVPYFRGWAGSRQFLLHDDTEELDFGRAIADFRDQYDCAAVGFNKDQVLLVDPCAVAIPKMGADVDAAIRNLNRHADNAERPGYLFELGSVAQYMWSSLPVIDGIRTFPTAGKIATGRYDLIRAIVNSMCTAKHFAELARGVQYV
jgi:hypothetical protein